MVDSRERASGDDVSTSATLATWQAAAPFRFQRRKVRESRSGASHPWPMGRQPVHAADETIAKRSTLNLQRVSLKSKRLGRPPHAEFEIATRVVHAELATHSYRDLLESNSDKVALSQALPSCHGSADRQSRRSSLKSKQIIDLAPAEQLFSCSHHTTFVVSLATKQVARALWPSCIAS
jgi:hypothetical protein